MESRHQCVPFKEGAGGLVQLLRQVGCAEQRMQGWCSGAAKLDAASAAHALRQIPYDHSRPDSRLSDVRTSLS